MEYVLNWNKLLCNTREREKTKTASYDFRSDFENDYDRIVFSAPFRRLQDKAQVFPLERNDFVRTRLTHSIEVATLARSIGVSISAGLLERGLISEKHASYIPVILESAGLAHDMGNPPFGHYGEETIRDAFGKWFSDHKEINLGKTEKADLMNFDGNCQMFRILTHLQCIKDEFGFNLTYGTLATLMKYPFDSIEGNKSGKDYKGFIEKNGFFYKKFGYFSSESELAIRILKTTGLMDEVGVYRHPLAFVLEAADDIAYLAGDLEDGYKKKLVSFDMIESYFDNDKAVDSDTRNLCETIKEIINSDRYYSNEKKLQDIRIVLQGFMKEKVVKSFVDNYDDIMNKKFKSELLSASEANQVKDVLKEISIKYIYQSSDIEKIELGGEHSIMYLVNRFLDTFLEGNNFIEFVLSKDERGLSQRQGRMYRLISEDFRKVLMKEIESLTKRKLPKDQELSQIYYYICMMITDYISGMTDSYCTELCRRIQGVGNK